MFLAATGMAALVVWRLIVKLPVSPWDSLSLVALILMIALARLASSAAEARREWTRQNNTAQVR
jgi:hypothetical protein